MMIGLKEEVLPVWTMLAVLEDVSDQVEVLQLHVGPCRFWCLGWLWCGLFVCILN